MLSTIIVLIAVAVASFVFRDVIYATGLYFVQYYRHGQAEAENDALDAMGENRVSYGLKDQLKRNKVVDDPNVNQLQDQVGDTAGGLTGKSGVGEGPAKGLSDVGGILSK